MKKANGMTDEWRLLAVGHPKRLRLDAWALRRACAEDGTAPLEVFNYCSPGRPRIGVPPVRFVSWMSRGRLHAGIVSSHRRLFVEAAKAVTNVVSRAAPGVRYVIETRKKGVARTDDAVFYLARRVVVRDWIRLRGREGWRGILAERFRRSLMREAESLGLDGAPIACGEIEVLGVLREKGVLLELEDGGRKPAPYGGLLWLLMACEFELDGSWFVGSFTSRGYGEVMRAGGAANVPVSTETVGGNGPGIQRYPVWMQSRNGKMGLVETRCPEASRKCPRCGCSSEKELVETPTRMRSGRTTRCGCSSEKELVEKGVDMLPARRAACGCSSEKELVETVCAAGLAIAGLCGCSSEKELVETGSAGV